MNLTPRQQFGLLAAVIRQPTLREQPKVARCFFRIKTTFTEPRARWLAYEVVLTGGLDGIKQEASRSGERWFFEFLKVSEQSPEAYSIPSFLL